MVLLWSWIGEGTFRCSLNLSPSLMKIEQNEKSTFIYEAGVWSGKYISFVAMGKIRKEDGRLLKPPKVYYQMP